MMETGALRLVARPNDPAIAPLARRLRQQGKVVHMSGGPGHPGAFRDVWFADQLAFLLHAADFRQSGIRANIVLRPGLDAGRDRPAIPMALHLARLLFGANTLFWAASRQSAAFVARNHGLETKVMESPSPVVCRNRPRLELSSRRGGLFLPEAPGISIPLGSANLVRLAARYNITCADPAEADGHDLAVLANGCAALREAREKRVLFILPAGAGLGHVSRSLAIADAMAEVACDFLVYNEAAYLAADVGHRVFQRQSAAQLGYDSQTWRMWETAALSAYLDAERPAAVIVDASHIDPFITDALLRPGAESTALIWVRREMWRADRRLRTAGSGIHADMVIVPGELAASAAVDPQRNDLAPCHDIAPVIFDGHGAPLSRRQARHALGLGRGRHCLISLGAWLSPHMAAYRQDVIQAAQANKVRLVWARSPLAGPQADAPPQMEQVALYPLTRYLAAFDGVISAAGYNSFHELMLRFGGPVLFLPVDEQGLDDQVARAGFAAENGLAEIVSPAASGQDIRAFFGQIRNGPSDRKVSRAATGAAEAAQLIRETVAAKRDGVDG